jgi:membrane protease YdiL (CAAX protease family)
MRALLYFAALFAVALGLVAVATWPAWELVNLFATVPFHRVGNRIAMLGLALGLYVVARRLGVANRAAMGYGVRRSQFVLDLLKGVVLGVLFMLPLALLMLALGLRDLNTGVTLGVIGKAMLVGLGSGLTVAFIEESFLRGAMYSAVSRESGVFIAIVSTSLLYAATHFFARYRIAPEDVTLLSGLDLLRGALGQFAQPRAMLDSFLSLAAVGALLAIVRSYRGNIAAGIGLHAGWVTVMLAVLRLTRVDPAASQPWLLSQHDGFVGYLTLGWTVVAAIPLLAHYRRQRRQAN